MSPGSRNRRSATASAILAATAVAASLFVSCGKTQQETDLAPKARTAEAAPRPAATPTATIPLSDGELVERKAPPYKVSARGGLPATGPGARYNHCERIWCMNHGENFFIDHFLTGHEGWILHDSAAGDVFVPKYRVGGPTFPGARAYALRLCGAHLHPYILGNGPVKAGMYTVSVGYNRAHFRLYGTKLDPCCLNGLGWDFIHSSGGRFFRFHDLQDYKENPERGWQKPFSPEAAPAAVPGG